MATTDSGVQSVSFSMDPGSRSDSSSAVRGGKRNFRDRSTVDRAIPIYRYARCELSTILRLQMVSERAEAVYTLHTLQVRHQKICPAHSSQATVGPKTPSE